MATDFARAMMDLMPQRFGNNSLDSNIGKFFQILNRQMQELETVFSDLVNILDLDTATSAQLDIFLSNLDVQRGSLDDIDVRKFVKTEIQSNFSKGQISTVREVSNVVLGENGLHGIEETWEQSRFSNQRNGLALLVSNLAQDIDIPEPTIEKTVAAGIKTFYEIVEETEIVLVEEPPSSQIPIRDLQSGTFSTPRQLGVIL